MGRSLVASRKEASLEIGKSVVHVWLLVQSWEDETFYINLEENACCVDARFCIKEELLDILTRSALNFEEIWFSTLRTTVRNWVERLESVELPESFASDQEEIDRCKASAYTLALDLYCLLYTVGGQENKSEAVQELINALRCGAACGKFGGMMNAIIRTLSIICLKTSGVPQMQRLPLRFMLGLQTGGYDVPCDFKEDFAWSLALSRSWLMGKSVTDRQVIETLKANMADEFAGIDDAMQRLKTKRFLKKFENIKTLYTATPLEEVFASALILWPVYRLNSKSFESLLADWLPKESVSKFSEWLDTDNAEELFLLGCWQEFGDFNVDTFTHLQTLTRNEVEELRITEEQRRAEELRRTEELTATAMCCIIS